MVANMFEDTHEIFFLVNCKLSCLLLEKQSHDRPALWQGFDRARDAGQQGSTVTTLLFLGAIEMRTGLSQVHKGEICKMVTLVPGRLFTPRTTTPMGYLQATVRTGVCFLPSRVSFIDLLILMIYCRSSSKTLTFPPRPSRAQQTVGSLDISPVAQGR